MIHVVAGEANVIGNGTIEVPYTVTIAGHAPRTGTATLVRDELRGRWGRLPHAAHWLGFEMWQWLEDAHVTAEAEDAIEVECRRAISEVGRK